MAVSVKLQTIADTDLSGLQLRIRELYEAARQELETKAAEKSAAGAPGEIDEAWVRKNLIPILDKITRLKR